MSIITPKPGYQCNPSDCAIIIKENGQLDFIHPIVAPTDSQPKNLEVFKNIVAALNQQLFKNMEITELLQRLEEGSQDGPKPTIH
jgi:hypothetical protein